MGVWTRRRDKRVRWRDSKCEDEGGNEMELKSVFGERSAVSILHENVSDIYMK